MFRVSNRGQVQDGSMLTYMLRRHNKLLSIIFGGAADMCMGLGKAGSAVHVSWSEAFTRTQCLCSITYK
jgi:hypothetical protein